MNGTSRFLILHPSVEPILTCKPLHLITPARLPFSLITGLLPIPCTLGGSREPRAIGEKSSCSSIPSTAANALAWHSPVTRCKQSMRQATLYFGQISIATERLTASCLD